MAEKAKKDLEEWNQRQSEQVEKNKINNRGEELSGREGEGGDMRGAMVWGTVTRMGDLVARTRRKRKR